MNTELIEQIQSGLREASSRSFLFRLFKDIKSDLRRAWELPDPPVVLYSQSVASIRYELDVSDAPLNVRASPKKKSPPPWLVGMTSGFLESTDRIDKKMKGRVFEAIAELSSSSLEPRGDTLKPLSAEFKGCWRYRIGDSRLIFRPYLPTSELTLISFSPRGSAYD